MNPLLPIAVALILLSAAMYWPSALIARRRRNALAHKVDTITRARPDKRGPDSTWIATTSVWFRALLSRPRMLFTVGIARDWGMHSGATRILLFAVAAGGLAWLLLRNTLHLSIWIAAIAAAAGFVLAPRAILRREQRLTEAQFTDLFPDAVNMLVRMVRAGLPVAAAVRTVSREAPPPVNAVFTVIADQIEIGIPLEEALAAWSERIGLADFRFFAAAVALQRATGGNLAVTLDSLTEIIRKRRAVRLKAHAATSDVRISAMVLGAIPFLIVGAIALLSPNYLAPLIYDPRGNIIAGIALTCLLLAGLSMRWIIQRGLSI